MCQCIGKACSTSTLGLLSEANGREWPKQREKRWIEKANSSGKNADSLRTIHKAQLVTRRLMRRSEYLILPHKIQTPAVAAVASLVQCKKHRESELQTLFLCSTQCKQPG